MERPPENELFKRTRNALREVDLLGLGDDFPSDEYDSVADRASSAHLRGASIDDAVEAVAVEFETNWGTTIGRFEKARLAKALRSAF